MALGDGVRRNILGVSAEEFERFSSALLVLQGKKFPRGDADVATSGIREWFTQLQTHLAADEHRGSRFLPWHRDLCNRLEQTLREIDPQLSLHYWDWNESPHALFTPRASTVALAEYGLPFDRDALHTRNGAAFSAPDSVLLRSPTYHRLRQFLERKHDEARFVYFGGTVINAHVSFHDPLGLLLLSNLDRLFAMWQAQGGHAWRLDPARIYGEDDRELANRLVTPWSGALATSPWDRPSAHPPRTYVHPSVVAPPCYDTLATRVAVDAITNPGQRIVFNDVQAGRTFARAASFRVHGRGNLRLSVSDGPTGPYSVITPGGAVTVAHSPGLSQEARIWFGFCGGEPGTNAAPGTVTIRCSETAQEFRFTLKGNTIAAPEGMPVPPGGSEDVSSASPASPPDHVTWTWSWRVADA
jgi:hypothetical protein